MLSECRTRKPNRVNDHFRLKMIIIRVRNKIKTMKFFTRYNLKLLLAQYVCSLEMVCFIC